MIDEGMNENSRFIKEHAIGVEKVYIPKGWKGNAYIKQLELHTYLYFSYLLQLQLYEWFYSLHKGDFPSNDIALLKLVKDVEIDGFMQMPLCLPETLTNEQVI